MNELFVIEKFNNIETVNARELHFFLEIKERFSTWIERYISMDEFLENIDYTLYVYIHPQNKQQMLDYHISLDMAKHLSMMSKSKKGKQARIYFIECEKKYNNTNVIIQETIKGIMPLFQEMIKENNKQLLEYVSKKENKQLDFKQDYYSILAYCKINNIQITFSEAIKFGKVASKLSRENNINIRRVNDERYGHVNSYNIKVLEKVFEL